MRRAALLSLAGIALTLGVPRTGVASGLKDDGRAGVVTAVEGVAVVRPVGRERWTPLDARALVMPGDVVRTEARGANALEVRLRDGSRVIVGPGALFEMPDGGGLRLLRGEVELKPADKATVAVSGPGGWSKAVAATTWLRATDAETKELPAEPRWLAGYRASTSEEWMGALLAKVDGKNVPLTVGYHKVVVEIRDQIARTTVEQSFVNSTDATLEGVFSFPLPADASISGFGMWIGDELVEADLVERERAREIYEDILRRKKDPGLLEWEGGNLFKARVFPIFPHSEKRIRLRYTEVLPLEGDAYRYRYALRSELLRSNPLRELSIAVNVVSTAAIRDVTSATHPITVRKTEHEAVAEFGAQQYVPERDLEIAVSVARGDGVSAIAHRRGEDGFFMLLLSPPDAGATGWQRTLVPDGAPLDLVLVADTSGSMDAAARAVQSSFLAAVLAQLSSKDRFRLVAFDVEPRWLVGDAVPVTEESVTRALAALDARFSLGWTDLERVVEALAGKAAAETQVIYVGDGIHTALTPESSFRGAGYVSGTADRVRARAASTGATFHAVSTSSAYEKSVLEALASAGGGSVRRAEGGVAAAARALVGEIARPGVRDVKVAIDGVPTAKVYPEVLPNLPLDGQQVVLGRFLPGESTRVPIVAVTVTGTLAGKPVRYASSFQTPASDEGNSFLPRLWARRHLDALLAQGTSKETKEEIVAFSREYQIMTPYTSFLVLENDEDRATYGVERTVKMRDAERFFADARDKAALEIARQQSATARRWRQDLRRRALAEIARLGRDLPIPAAVGWMEETASSARKFAFNGRGGGAGGGFRGQEISLEPSNYSPPESDNDVTIESDNDVTIEFAEQLGAHSRREAEEGVSRTPDAAPAMAAAASPMTTPGDPMGAEESGKLEESFDELELADKEVASREDAPSGGESFDDGNFDGAKDSSRSERRRMDSGIAYGKSAGRGFVGDRRLLESAIGMRPQPPSFTPAQLGFPSLGEARATPPPRKDPEWDALVLEALRTLDRRPALAALAGGVRVTSAHEALHSASGRALSRSRSTALASARRWTFATEGFQAARYEAWLSETEQGVVDAALRLGRKRAAVESDRGRPPTRLADRAFDDVVAAFAATHRRAPRERRAKDVVTITFTADHDVGYEHELDIDVARRVLLEERTLVDGDVVRRVRFSGFVDVAGRAWATKVETFDDEDHAIARTTFTVEAVDVATFSRELDAFTSAHADVVFLGATDPDLLDARQAVRDGRAGFAERLAIVLSHGERGRFDDLWKAWPDAESLIAGKPGVAWLRLALLARSRRGDELAAHATAMAQSVAKDDSPAAAPRARMLDEWSSSLGARERLALLETVRPAWGRGPDADAWTLHGRRREAQALAAAGFSLRSAGIVAAIATERPFDATAVLARGDGLRMDDDSAGAAAYLADRVGNGGPWTRDEVERLFGAWTARLWELRDLPALAAAVDAWVAKQPRTETAYAAQVALLYLRGRDADGERWVLERLRAEAAALADPAALAATNAAVHLAFGQAAYWGGWSQSIAPQWRAPLADLADRLARSDTRAVDLAGTILNDWRFRQTDEAHRVLTALRVELAAPGAIAAVPLLRLARVARWIETGTDANERKAIVEGLLARWRATTDPVDRDLVADVVLGWLPPGGRAEERIAFLRERLARATPRDVWVAARTLFDALVEGPHESAREDEAFALVPRLFEDDGIARDAPAEKETNGLHAAGAMRRLAEWVGNARQRAALGAPEAGKPWTRAESAQRTRAARTKAQAETAARFAAARDATATYAAGAIVRPWAEVERLGYFAETQADLVRSEGEARELLDAVPVGSSTDVDRLLAERSAVVLAYAATRPKAPAGLADRVVAQLRARVDRKSRVLDERYHLFRLLVALDRVPDIETALTAWVRPDEVDLRWRVALARIYAETDRLREAAATLETASTVGELDAAAWAELAQWYLVLKEDARREAALDRRLATLPVWQLTQRLWQEGARIQRHGDGVPAELDPEALRILRFLLQKTEDPAQHVNAVQRLYEPTKDFRVLEALADGVAGHSAEAVYRYLEQATNLLGNVHEEATCDALAARIALLLRDAKRDVDRRALRLLLVAVEARAGEVPKADRAHADRALEALRVAFEGALVPGERPLLAQRVATMRMKDARLADLAMRRLEELLAGADGTVERLAVGRWLAHRKWEDGKREDAVDRLDALLEATRAEPESRRTAVYVDAYDRVVGWWTDLGRFRVVETRLRRDLDEETRSHRREVYRMRLFALAATALARDGALSIGSRGDLFRAASDAMERHLLDGPAYLLSQTTQHHGALHEAAASKKVGDAGGSYRRFVNERLPQALDRDPVSAQSILGSVLPRLRQLAGPLPAISATLDFMEREPAWRRAMAADGWQHYAHMLAQWRRDAGRDVEREPRLATLVLRQLEAELTSGNQHGSSFWYRSSNAFWSELAADFAGVAARVAEVNAKRPATVQHVASYQWDGLHLRREAIATLQTAMAHGNAPADLRATLAEWLRLEGRYAEALPVVMSLVADQPDQLHHRTLHAAVLHGLGRSADALRALTDAETRWKDKKWWRMDVAAALANAALETKHAKSAAEWIEDALRMRREAGGRGTEDATLAAWYGVLARARSLLGETDGAVKAAAAGVVAWGRQQQQRANAIKALHDVLASAPDLAAWVVRYEAEVAASGLDAPLLRKTLGQIHADRNGQAVLAVRHLRIARELDPADVETHALLLRSLDAAGDATGALDALLVSLRSAPKNVGAYDDLANRFERQGDAESAERARTNAVEAMPSEPDGARILAKIREGQRKWDLAAAAWRHVARVRPNEPEGWLELARAQIEAGDSAGARTTLTHVDKTVWESRFGDVRAKAYALSQRLR